MLKQKKQDKKKRKKQRKIENGKLPQKNGSKITFASPSIHYKIKPGSMIIIPAYVPHQYPVDYGLDPFRFIHWNAQAVPSAISKETSICGTPRGAGEMPTSSKRPSVLLS